MVSIANKQTIEQTLQQLNTSIEYLLTELEAKKQELQFLKDSQATEAEIRYLTLAARKQITECRSELKRVSMAYIAQHSNRLSGFANEFFKDYKEF